jgi:hypothetical protein
MIPDKSQTMTQSFYESNNRKALMIHRGALVRAHQNYFDAKNAEFTRLIERVIVFEKRLSECEILIAEWQKAR